MAKKNVRFYCKSCGHEELRWLGQCPGCHEWNTFVEAKMAAAEGKTKGSRGFSAGNKQPVGFGASGRHSGAAAAWPDWVRPRL